MKRILCMMIAAVLLFAPMYALAAETGGTGAQPPAGTSGSPGPSVSPSAAVSAAEALQIDNLNVYPGMDKPYQQGYIPAAGGGVAKVVLPLVPVAGAQIKDNQIRVTFDLGDASSSPFQFGNYDQTISLSSQQTGGGAVQAYYIGVDFPLSERRVMGRYPLVTRVSGALADGTPFSQSFTVYVTIADGKDPSATPTPDPTPTPPPEEQPVPQPKVMISGYSVSPSPVVAGQAFEASVTLLNTNDDQNISNVKVTVKGETTDFLSADKTNTFYFDSIQRGQAVTLKMKMQASRSAKAVPQKLLLAIEYEGSKAVKYETAEEIVVPVTQTIRLEYDEPQIPKDVNAGDTIQVSLNVMNLGLGTVHNVRMELDAAGLIPEETAFIGNVESGAAKKGDIYVFVGTKDMAEGGGDSEKYGFTDGNVRVTYEDEFGQEFAEEFPFETNINPPLILNDPEDDEEQEKPENQGQWWGSVAAAGGIIAAILILRRYIKKKERAKREEDEAE